MRSPAFTCSRPQVYATRFTPSVALRTKMTSRELAAFRTVTAIGSPEGRCSCLPRVQLFADEVVALRLELRGELAPAGAHDAPVDEDVNEVRGDVPQDALVVRDEQDAHIRCAKRLDAARDDLQRIDVEPRVGLVEH